MCTEMYRQETLINNTTDIEMTGFTVRSSWMTHMEKSFGLLRQDLNKKQHTDTQSCITDLLHS